MSTPEGEYYSAERWQNWLERLREEDVDLEDEDTARLRINLQDDAVIAVAKVLTAYDDEELDQEEALEELAGIREVVLTEVEFDDEDTLLLVDAVQTALVSVFYAAEEYVAGGPAEGTVDAHVEAAVDAEHEDDLETALGHCAQAGTLIIDGREMDLGVAEGIEYGRVAEWVNGLDSLYEAMSDPEVVEEEDENH
jgi:hypothetical protein